MRDHSPPTKKANPQKEDPVASSATPRPQLPENNPRIPDYASPQTRAVRAGRRLTPEGEHSEPLFLTSSFVFENARQAAERFRGEQAGNIYSRFTNPTVRIFEERLAEYEGGERCIATSSGMSAILTTCMGLLSTGDHIVAARNLFGTTLVLLRDVLARFGLESTFVDVTSFADWEAAIRPKTRMLFLETPSNPLTEVADLERLARLAHKHGSFLVVDNCFCTPALQRPLEYGADLVIHSATKYLDGQGRCVGGALVGPRDLLEGKPFAFLRSAGPSMSPFNAWVFLKGLETLELRMRAHSKHALFLARQLQRNSAIQKIYYPGLPGHPQYRLARRQQQAGGGVLSLELAGGREAAWRFIDRLRLFSITANLGDAKSTVTHPDTTTHWRLSPEEKKHCGITPGLVRLSVGLENPRDLARDVRLALKGSLAEAQGLAARTPGRVSEKPKKPKKKSGPRGPGLKREMRKN